MLNKSHQNISNKETIIFCLVSGIFIYAVTCIPRISQQLFPSKPTPGIDICLYGPPTVLIYPYIIGFGFFMFFGIWVLRKINFNNKLAHYSFLSLILSIGGGLLTGVLESFYYLFFASDSDDRILFLNRLVEDWFETLVYESQVFGWAIIFPLIMIPFTIVFLIIISLITKFSNRQKFR